jgi:hypothetical protein
MPVKLFCVTPTISSRTPFTISVLPTASPAPAKRDCHIA